MMNTTKATAFWQSKKPSYFFQNSAQFILNGKDNSKRHSLGATASCGACGDGPCGVGGCGRSGCDSY